MSFYFGTGERFRGNPEFSPGPGKYDPRPVEGFKADPKSAFLTAERFKENEADNLGAVPETPPAQKARAAVSTDAGRQFNWTTKRISELQNELDQCNKTIKAFRDRSDKESKQHQAELNHQKALLRLAEDKENSAVASKLKAEQEAAERLMQLRSAKEALEQSQKDAKDAVTAKEQMEDSLAAQWQEMQADLIKERGGRKLAEEQASQLLACISRLGSGPVSSAEAAENAVEARIAQGTRFEQDLKQQESLILNLKADAEASAEALAKLDSARDAAERQADKLASQVEELQAALAEQIAELERQKEGSAEDLRSLRCTAQEEQQALHAAVAAGERALKAELSSCGRLRSENERLAADLQLVSGRQEVLQLELENLQTVHKTVQSDFEQYKKDARGQYERLTSSFEKENQLCSSLAADLKVSQAEGERLGRELAENGRLHRIEVERSAAETAELQSTCKSLRAVEADLSAERAALTAQVAALARDKDAQIQAVADLRAEAAALQETKSSLEASITALEGQLTEAIHEREGLAEALSEAESRLSSTSAEAEAARVRLENEISELQGSAAKVAAELAERGSLLEGAKSDIESLQEGKVAAERTATQLQDEMVTLQAALSEAMEERDAAEALKNSLSVELADLKARLDASREDHEAANKRVCELEEEQDAVKAALAAESLALEDAGAAKLSLEKQLKQATSDVRLAQERVAELEAQLAAARGDVSQQQAAHAALAEAYENASKKTAALELHVGKLQEAAVRATEREQQLCEAAAASAVEVGALRGELEQASSKAASLERHHQEALKQAGALGGELRSEGERSARLVASVEDLRSQLDAKEEALEDATAQLSKAVRQGETSSAALRAAEVAKLEIRQELEQACAELEGRQAAVEAREEELSKIRAELAATQAKLSSLGAKMTEQNEQLLRMETLRKELEAAQAEVTEAESLATERDREKIALAAELQLYQSKHSEAESELRAVVERAREAELRADRLEQDVKALREEAEQSRRDGSAELMAELQEENLHMHEALQDFEVRSREAEEAAARKATQVETLQERLIDMEEEALAARSTSTETQRLTEENALLATQLRQMEVNIQDLMNTQGLGHNNSKQRIQYHLRLKQELEEMRHECMQLLRERFHLEQCVRYLAARAAMPRFSGPDFGGILRTPAQKNPVQPASLQKSHLFATPSGRALMLRSGRGVAAVAAGGSTPTKAELVASIEQAVSRTASSFAGLAGDVENHADAAATPLRRLQSVRSTLSDDSASSSSAAPSEDGERVAKPGDGGSEEPLSQAAVEKRIISKIVDICSPGKTGRTSRLMQRVQEFPDIDGDSAPTTPKGSKIPNSQRGGLTVPQSAQKLAAKSLWKR